MKKLKGIFQSFLLLTFNVSSIVFPFFRAEATLMASVCAVGLESVGNFHFAWQ